MKHTFLFILSILFFSCNSEEIVEHNPTNSAIKTTDEKDAEITKIENYIIQNPNQSKGYLDRATYLLSKNNLKTAFEDIDKAMKIEPKNPEINYTKGLIYNKMGKIEMALPFFERTIQLDSLHTDANLKTAYIYLLAKNYEESLFFINRVIKKDKFLAEPYYLKGMWYENQEQNDLAISSYQTAVERNTNYYNAYLALGAIHDKLDNPLAIDYFNSAITIHPNSIEAWRGKGMSYFNHEEFEEAYICFDTILSIDSTFEVSYFDMGRTLIGMCYDKNTKQKNDSLLNQAILLFDKALGLNTNYIPARYNRGLCYETLGNKEIAKAEYTKILEIEENYDLAIKGLNRL